MSPTPVIFSALQPWWAYSSSSHPPRIIPYLSFIMRKLSPPCPPCAMQMRMHDDWGLDEVDHAAACYAIKPHGSLHGLLPAPNAFIRSSNRAEGAEGRNGSESAVSGRRVDLGFWVLDFGCLKVWSTMMISTWLERGGGGFQGVSRRRQWHGICREFPHHHHDDGYRSVSWV